MPILSVVVVVRELEEEDVEDNEEDSWNDPVDDENGEMRIHVNGSK